MSNMKRIIISSLFAALLFTLLYACRKDNINGDSKNLLLGSYITLDSTINSILDVSNSSATVSIKVKNSVGSPVSTINIFVATKSNTEDTTGWILVKSVPFSAGVVLSVSTAELSKALGVPAAPGTKYTLQNQVVTTDGRKYSTYNTPDNYNSFPAYNMALTWYATAICPFVAPVGGTYTITKDAWDDYNVPTVIPGAVVDGPGPNQISIYVYPATKPVTGGNGYPKNPIVVTVNPANGSATVVKSDIGNYGGDDYFVTGSGYVFSCVGVIDLSLDFVQDGADQGVYEMILRKN